MKKNLLFVFLIIMIIPISIKGVFADTICQDINKKTEEYNGVIKQINTQKCDDKDLSNVDTTCSNLYSRKNLLLSELFELDEKSSTCDKTELKNIIDSNKDKCYNDISTTIDSIAKTINKYFYVLGTFLFIIFGSLDWFKNVVGSDEKSIAKNRTNFFKRLISLILIYMLPFIVNMIFSVLPEHYRLGTKKYICATQSYYVKKSNININVESPTTTPTTTPKIETRSVEEVRNEIVKQAIAVKKYTNKNKTKWCAKRVNSAGKEISKKCPNTRNVEKQATSKRLSCASLVSIVLYKAGIYEASDINGHNINAAWSTAKYLRDKGWTVITNKKKLKPGDICFYKGASATGKNKKKAFTIGGKTYDPGPGHVDIYAGGGKVYNTGSTKLQRKYIKSGFDSSRFYFALRYNGK